SLSRDLFVELALGSIVATTVEASFFVCSRSVRARGIAETSVSAMVSMTSGGVVPVRNVFQTANEDRQIATKLNRLREEMLVIREKRRNLVDELKSIIGIVIVGKTAKFVSETVRKDNAQIGQLREVESQMEVRALEKELHVQKIVGNIPY
ncbi:hypothetical protein Tco_1579967, partial [Tanacetum coccineum]